MTVPIIPDGFPAALTEKVACGFEAVLRNEAQFLFKLDAISMRI
jgi:hypothetical protein